MQSVHKWLMSAAIVFVVVPFILAFSVSANG
jgi:predicted Co/Zn/Cd cation transporter (cation efflux family)